MGGKIEHGEKYEFPDDKPIQVPKIENQEFIILNVFCDVWSMFRAPPKDWQWR